MDLTFNTIQKCITWPVPDLWFYFKIFFTAFLVITMIMMLQSNHFYTRVGSVKKFSMLDLEFPTSSKYMAKILNGIYKLPSEKVSKVLGALRCNLFLDFLFMPAAYGSIFLLCMHIADRNNNILFTFLAWLQILAYAFDVIENITILKMIKQSPPLKIVDFIRDVEDFKEPVSFVLYTRMVIIKWIIAITGFMCAFMMMLYFWLANLYNPERLPQLYFLIAEVAVFILLTQAFKKYSKYI
ncbi:MAG TPA: hypothetical protein VK590_15470 [Saprospiraceae bacterium]|nr:hypothetical protein [Saprospiraceae bacterium]